MEERKKFLDIYFEFEDYLKSLGFRTSNWKENSTDLDYYYSHYNKYINPLYGVECYIHNILDFSIRFLRDRNEHKFMLVGQLGAVSKIYSIDEFKEIISNEVRELRDEKISKLSVLNNI